MQEHKLYAEEALHAQSEQHDKQIVDYKSYLEKTVTVRIRTSNDILNLKKIEMECANQKVYH